MNLCCYLVFGKVDETNLYLTTKTEVVDYRSISNTDRAGV